MKKGTLRKSQSALIVEDRGIGGGRRICWYFTTYGLSDHSYPTPYPNTVRISTLRLAIASGVHFTVEETVLEPRQANGPITHCGAY